VEEVSRRTILKRAKKQNLRVKYRCQGTREWREYICCNELFTYLFIYLFVCLVSYMCFTIKEYAAFYGVECFGNKIIMP